MASRRRHGRTQLDLTGVCNLTEASTATVDYWHLHRANNQFPECATIDSDGRRWWWQNDIQAFHAAHRARRAASFTDVDRHGDPFDLLTAPQAAKVLGYKDHRSLTPSLRHHPDDVTVLPSGLLRRRWYRHTIWTFADTRVDRHSSGRPPGSRAKTGRVEPYTNDPRLVVARELLEQASNGGQTDGLGVHLASQLDISERTGQRLINAARNMPRIARLSSCQTTEVEYEASR
jgi:hypothetical protein